MPLTAGNNLSLSKKVDRSHKWANCLIDETWISDTSVEKDELACHLGKVRNHHRKPPREKKGLGLEHSWYYETT